MNSFCWRRMSLPRQFPRCEGVILPLAVEIVAQRPRLIPANRRQAADHKRRREEVLVDPLGGKGGAIVFRRGVGNPAFLWAAGAKTVRCVR